MVSRALDDLFHKFMEQVESVFKNLPKPLQWRSFLNKNHILLTDIPLKIQKLSVQAVFQIICPQFGHWFKNNLLNLFQEQCWMNSSWVLTIDNQTRPD